jgi:hypothetical protein
VTDPRSLDAQRLDGWRRHIAGHPSSQETTERIIEKNGAQHGRSTIACTLELLEQAQKIVLLKKLAEPLDRITALVV